MLKDSPARDSRSLAVFEECSARAPIFAVSGVFFSKLRKGFRAEQVFLMPFSTDLKWFSFKSGFRSCLVTYIFVHALAFKILNRFRNFKLGKI